MQPRTLQGTMPAMAPRPPESRRTTPPAALTLGTLAAVFALLALLAAFTNAPGWYIADARFEHYWGGGQFVTRQQWAWDAFRGLGRPIPFFSPVVGTFLSGVQALGASPWVSERLLHATYLVIAGFGMVLVLRLFRPRVGIEHVLAGVVYMFSPYTSQFLIPSGLFLHFAIAPWLVVALVRGARDRELWKWAAAFALAVFSVGGLNAGSLAYALVPLLPVAIYLVVVERSTSWREVGAWVVRVGLLTLLISSAVAVYLLANVTSVSENLGATELPSTVSRHASWAESWRGLGLWLTYFRTPSGDPLRPESSAYFTNTLVIFTTFAVPCIALATFWRSRWQPRVLFAMLIAVSLVLMVGVYPPSNPPPLGRLFEDVYDNILLSRGLRAGYKAGAGFEMGVAALFGVGIVDAVTSIARRRPSWTTRQPLTALVVAVPLVAVASFPFWTGNLYSRSDRVERVPGYWLSAASWLDDQPAPGSVLVLPGSTRTRYEWGYVGDDIFDALLHRRHVVRQSLSQGTAEAANALVTLDESVRRGEYVSGLLGPMAARLGIGWVVIRNDLDWESIDAPRPSALDTVRQDPDLVRRETFGRPGENVHRQVGADETERRLPPVEIYRVEGSGDRVQLRPPGPPTVLSGDADAWGELAATGRLDDGRPVEYSADLTADTLMSRVREGAPVVVTDTNRRLVTKVTMNHNFLSYTLAPHESLERTPRDLFHRVGSQTVATYGDARSVRGSRFGSTSGTEYQNWLRPPNAVDGDLDTAWAVGGSESPVGDWLRVEFARPHYVSEMTFAPYAASERVITRATIRFSEGSEVPFRVEEPTTEVKFRPRRTAFVDVRIDRVQGSGLSNVGFSEIRVPGLQFVEALEVPDDLFGAAERHRNLRRSLAEADVSYEFERLTGGGPRDEEPVMRRRFSTVGDRDYELTGALRVGISTPDALLDRLVGGPVGAYGSSRFNGRASARGDLAIDGDETTAWEVQPTFGETLTLRFPAHVVDHIDVAATARSSNTSYARPTRVRVTLNPEAPEPVVRELDIDPLAPCEDVTGSERDACVTRYRIDVPPTLSDTAILTLVGVAPNRRSPVSLAEVEVGTTITATTPRDVGCLDLFNIDGTAVPVRFEGTLEHLLNDESVSYAACGPVALIAGRHLMTSTDLARGLVSTVRLHARGRATASTGRRGTVIATHSSPTEHHVRVRAPDGGYLVLSESFDEGWRLHVDGKDARVAAPEDGMAGWRVPPGAAFEATISYGPQRAWEVALGLTLGTVGLCLWLVLLRPRTRRRIGVSRARTTQSSGRALDRHGVLAPGLGSAVAIVVALGMVGYLLGGPAGAIVALAAAIVGIWEARLVALTALVEVALAGVWTIIEKPLGGRPLSTFVDDHRSAATTGQLAGIILIAAVVTAARAVRTDPLKCTQDRPWGDAYQRSGHRAAMPSRRRFMAAAAALLPAGSALSLLGTHSLRPLGLLTVLVVAVSGLVVLRQPTIGVKDSLNSSRRPDNRGAE